jgi:hypothetical protein
MNTAFLDRLASQLKIGKDPACRRAIVRILDSIKKGYENGQYQNPPEAERAFRQLVESDVSAQATRSIRPPEATCRRT